MSRFSAAAFLFALGPTSCSLAPSDPEVQPLATLNGTVRDEVTVTFGDPLDVVLTWYTFTLNTGDDTTWLTDLRAPVVDGRFSLDVSTPPVEDARFTTPDGDDFELSVAFLSVVNRRIAPNFDWASPFEDGEGSRFPVVGGREDLVLVYLDAPTAVRPPFPLGGRPLQPGYNLVAITFNEEDEPEDYERLPLDTSIEIDVSGDWFPNAEACGLVEQDPPFDVFLGDEDFPETIPPDGVCLSCGEDFLVDSCEVFFDALCAECQSLRLIFDPVLEETWPCIPEGESCEEGETRCAIDQLYTCEDGILRRTADCSEGESCCESGCTPLN